MALVSGVILLGALVGGATFALFTDSKSTTASYQAGTLAVEIHSDSGDLISDADGPPLMNIPGMAPGDPASVYFAKVHNSGSLPLTYNLSFFRPAGPVPAAVDNALAGALMMTVERETSPGVWGVVGDMSIAAWNALGATAGMPTLAAGQDHRFRLAAQLPLATGNPAQGGNVQLSFQVNATQPTALNYGFESGDLSGWNVYIPPDGSLNAIQSFSPPYGNPNPGIYTPAEGSYFAGLKTDGPGSYTTLSRDFTVGAGDTVSGSAFFWDAEGGPGQCFHTDNAYIEIRQGSTAIATVWSAGSCATGTTPWQTWSHSFAAGGTYTIFAKIANGDDHIVDSYMGFDNMTITH